MAGGEGESGFGQQQPDNVPAPGSSGKLEEAKEMTSLHSAKDFSLLLGVATKALLLVTP
jgi:hypothetical protein